jgi:hypothetical protein
VDGALLGSADHFEIDRALRRCKGIEQIVNPAGRLPRSLCDEIAFSDAGRRSWATLLHLANEQALHIRQANCTSQSPRHVRGGNSDPEAGRRGGLAATKRVHPFAERLAGRDSKVEALTEAIRVDA